MHLITQDFSLTKNNNFSLDKWHLLFGEIEREIKQNDPKIHNSIKDELDFLQNNWPKNLPFSVIHADLFPDNVFFDGTEISGIIDFYFACNDFMLFDLAIAITAWCFDEKNQFSNVKAKFLLDGYQKIRAINAQEFQYLNILLRGASVRFLLTRYYDLINQDENITVTKKDPKEYYKKLVFFQENNIADAIYK